MEKGSKWLVITYDAYDFYNREFDSYLGALEHYEKMVKASKSSAKLNELRDFDYPKTNVLFTRVYKEYNPYEAEE